MGISMKITVLDGATLGSDLDLSPLSQVGETDIYNTTLPEEVETRIAHSDVVIINKVLSIFLIALTFTLLPRLL